jgi:hypothetical protein
LTRFTIFRPTVSAFAIFFVLFLLGGQAHGQWYEPLLERDRQTREWSRSAVTVPLDEPFGYYYRLLQISGRTDRSISFFMRPTAIPGGITGSHPWESRVQASDRSARGLQMGVLNPVWFSSWNSSIPRGGNDGALWQGRGLNTSLSFGARASFGPLVVQLRPALVRSQNKAFDLMPYSTANRSAYTYPLRRFDYAQRFGDEAFGRLDAGDSWLELRLRAWAIGGGQGSQWSGPAVTYPLLFSTNAPGFWHVRLGTWRPARTPVGDVEFKYLAGVLEHSEYYIESLNDKIRTVHHLYFGWSPVALTGLSVGLQRMYVENEIQNPLKDIRAFLYNRKMFNPVTIDELNKRSETGDGHGPDNQVITLFARWQFSDVGFELYAEYGRNDHTQNLRDLRLQPEHARAYLLGLIKVFELDYSRFLAFNVEVSQREDTRAGLARSGPIPKRGLSTFWHAHSRNPFTHRGQVMGASTGAGDNTRGIRADLFYPEGKIGARVTRIGYNNTLVHRYFSSIRNAQREHENLQPKDVRQAELQLAVEYTRFFGRYGLELDAMVEIGHTLNHHYLYRNDVTNLRLMITLRRYMKGGGR